MDKNNKMDNDVHIEQVNPPRELNDLEKTAIIQFHIDNKEKEYEKEKELSKTLQLNFLNNKRKKVVNEFELPMEEKNIVNSEEQNADNFTVEIQKKLNDLKDTVKKMEDEVLTQEENKKKSLYETTILKLADIIENRKALKNVTAIKVINVVNPMYANTDMKSARKIKDITKNQDFILNVDSEDYVQQFKNLNNYAINKLNSKRNVDVRDKSKYKSNTTFESAKVPKEDYLAYKDQLISFAIDKLYYQYALKETKKYKMYKFSVALSVLVFLLTSLVILSWFVQGVNINNLSNSLVEVAPVEQVEDGTLVNVELIEDVPTEEDGSLDKEVIKKNDMYWQYLNTPLSSVDFTQLLKQNKDTVGWLIVNNTNINYPVVQTTNNDYYLDHAFDRSKNYAGWVYADFRNDFDNLSKNTVIYAHGRKDGVMFGSLISALKNKWYTELDNQIIQLSTLKYNTMWQIFSVYKIEAESYYITTDFSSDQVYEEFINTMKSRSLYDFGVDLNSSDRILTLSTCYNDNGIRLVVQAKLVKIQER